MPLSPEAIQKIRGWTGSEPDDDQLQGLWLLYKNHDRIVTHVLRERISELSLEVSSLSVPGLSISHSTDLQAAQALLKEFLNSGGLGLDGTKPSFSEKFRRRFPR